MKIHSIEGNRQCLDGGAMFGNAPRELWQKWIQPDAQNRISLACRSFLFETDKNQKILFEAGVGAFFEPKLKERYGIVDDEHLLLRNLVEIGVAEEKIDLVILSHLHFDHAGGLLSSYGEKLRLLFPNAHYVVSKEHWEYAQAPHMREKSSFIPELHRLLRESNRLLLIDEKSQEFIKPFSFRFSYGHTIGMMLTEMHFNEKKYVFVGDLVPGIAWAHLPITMGYDRFPELLVDEKQRFFAEWVKNEVKILFTHDPKVASARLIKDKNGKYSAQECSF